MTPGESLERFIRWVCRDVKFHRHYPATVELVHPDGAMDVTPDDEEIRGLGLAHVFAQSALPATRTSGAKGSRCLVGFHAGDPKRPYISAWAEGSTPSLIAVSDGTSGVAAMGDPVEILLPDVVTIEGLLAGFIQPPGLPPPPPIPLLPPGVPFSGTATVLPGTVSAQVAGGNPRFLVPVP